MPSWFAEFARQQQDKFQELMHISQHQNEEIKRLNDDTAGPSQVRSLSLGNDEKKDDLSQTYRLESTLYSQELC
jgi:3-methyladenine DNA glycosylase AlkC